MVVINCMISGGNIVRRIKIIWNLDVRIEQLVRNVCQIHLMIGVVGKNVENMNFVEGVNTGIKELPKDLQMNKNQMGIS